MALTRRQLPSGGRAPPGTSAAPASWGGWSACFWPSGPKRAESPGARFRLAATAWTVASSQRALRGWEWRRGIKLDRESEQRSPARNIELEPLQPLMGLTGEQRGGECGFSGVVQGWEPGECQLEVSCEWHPLLSPVSKLNQQGVYQRRRSSVVCIGSYGSPPHL